MSNTLLLPGSRLQRKGLTDLNLIDSLQSRAAQFVDNDPIGHSIVLSMQYTDPNLQPVAKVLEILYRILV